MTVELHEVVAKPAALTDWAYNTVRDAILNLTVQPGSQLHVEALAEQLRISRTPVREALLRLESDGLVRTVPRVGFFVVEITRADLAELFELRELLESHATAKAAAQLDHNDLAYCDELLAKTEQAVAQGDTQKFLELEEAFHSLLTQRCNNRRLVNVMESMYDLTRRERVLSMGSPENLRLSLAEHRAVVEALRCRDGAEAGELMRKHIRAAGERLMRSLDPA